MATEPQDAAKATAGADKPAAPEGNTDGKIGAKAPGSELAELQAKLETERRELNDRLLRLAAEFENYKRRARKELDEAGLRGIENALKELLPPLDNLDRAIVASRAGGANAATALLEGVQLVQKLFLTALEKLNVKPIEAEGQPFDPNFHEAVQQVESPTLPPGSVATVYQRGYVHTGTNRLLRPAVVSVVRGKADGETSKQPN